MKPPAILLTSAGSLVGKVVLDSLEGRRAGLRLVGCDASGKGPNQSRCDAIHSVPLTGKPGWADAILSLVRKERPDVVIPGRDDDVEELAVLASEHPELRQALMAGSPEVAHVISDKSLTAEFAGRHSLAFAETVLTGHAHSPSKAETLVQAHGFPLIAKPAKGSGSLGVHALLNAHHLKAALASPGMVIQPFVGAPKELRLPTDIGLPLFWEIPETSLYAVQYLIGRDGAILGRCAHRSRMVRGRCEELWASDDPGLLAVTDAFARAAVAQGWRGPFNVQAKRAHSGQWKVIELNGRFSGGTSSRRFLGFDEVADLINNWLGYPVVAASPHKPVRHVVRQLADYPVHED